MLKFKLLCLFCCVYRSTAVGSYNNDVGFDQSPHECERKCEANAAPKTCKYHFYLEWYVTMSKACYNCPHNLTDCARPHCVAGDGQRRQFISINRQLPGPKIEVCKGDTIQVTLSNRLGDGRVAAFHWHGQVQAETPWMDGVPYVTQCPIMPGQDFEYKFKADPEGTYMYHSHVGLSLSDGVFGPLVVKQPESDDPNSGEYDHDCTHTPSGDCEHVGLVTDWTKGEAWGDYLMARWHSGKSEFKKSGLLNGKNGKTAATNVEHPYWANASTPYEVFLVQPNKKYRFRMINIATTECRYRISVHNHPLTVIATDGLPVRPHVVDAITYFPGERFDFVLATNQTVGNYWMQGWPIGECGETAAVYAILRYEGADEVQPTANKDSFNTETHLNPIIEEDDGDWGTINGQMRVSELKGFDSIPNKPADVTYYVGMDEFTNNGAFNHPQYYSYKHMAELFIPDTAVFNNVSFYCITTRFLDDKGYQITFTFPASPVLYQYKDINENVYCDQFNTNQDDCYEERCHCTHRVKVPKGALVEMVLVNEMKGEGAEGHPIHAHGQHFHLLGMGKVKIPFDKWEAKRMNDAGELRKNFVDPPIKDTVQITGGGYAVIRFTPTPGVWLIHCHIQWHRMDGQAFILQVGEYEDFPEVPSDMPRCGKYPGTPPPPCPSTSTSVNGTLPLMLLLWAALKLWL